MMKWFVIFIFCSSLYSCKNAISQTEDDIRREEAFENAMKNAKATTEESIQIQKTVDKKTERVVKEASKTIISLKEEVKDLKQELNEVNKTLDSIATDPGVKFYLRPISDTSENR